MCTGPEDLSAVSDKGPTVSGALECRRDWIWAQLPKIDDISPWPCKKRTRRARGRRACGPLKVFLVEEPAR